MATLTQSIAHLVALIAEAPPETQRRYHIELTAFEETKRGDPFDETRYHHAHERYVYRDARERAYWQAKIEGL